MPKRTLRRRRLETRLLGEATPLFFLDGKRRLIFFNDGCERLTGWRSDEVLGKVCDYAVEVEPGSPAALCSAFAPPPEVIADGRSESVPVTLVHKDGTATERQIHFQPLLDADGAVDLVLGIFGDRRSEIGGRRSESAAQVARKLHAELAALRVALRQRYELHSFIARSDAMQRVAEQVKLAKAAQCPVLITGEAGTGKEHVARVIHNEGPAGSQLFVPLDCARLPMREIRNALRRILHFDEPPDVAEDAIAAAPDEPAAAHPSRAAALQPATVFLQSVDRLGRDVQEMLVNASREQLLQPPGGVRVLAGSEADLQQAVRDDALRADFYFLLSALHIALPPLRNRPDDLEPLGQHFLEELNRGREEQVGEISEAVWEQFRTYQWPGNLAELQTVIAEARENCRGTVIEISHLPFRFRTGLDAQSVGPPVKPLAEPLADYLATVEAERIRDVLEQVRHNKTLAAKTLGMTRTRLYRRMESLGIEDLEE